MGERTCRLCGHQGTRTIRKLKKHTLQQCMQCRIIFLDPFPDDTETIYREDALNNAEYYDANRAHDLASFGRRLAIVRRVTQQARGRVLDYGCSTGNFMEAARSAGYSVVGKELNRESIKLCKKKGFSVNTGIKPGAYNIVHASDVIEHVRDINAFLRELRGLAKDNGIVVISTPDYENFFARHTQVKPREHLYYFTKATLAEALHKAGFDVLYIKNFSRKRSLDSLLCSATTEQRRVRYPLKLFRALRLGFIINPILSHLQDDILAIARKA
jgi:2-polyprenyl-3-methyl-5-hydroxy-6-metoxy-1,4-benzoquinol methylase